jgi:hypothetical protein
MLHLQVKAFLRHTGRLYLYIASALLFLLFPSFALLLVSLLNGIIHSHIRCPTCCKGILCRSFAHPNCYRILFRLDCEKKGYSNNRVSILSGISLVKKEHQQVYRPHLALFQ